MRVDSVSGDYFENAQYLYDFHICITCWFQLQ